MPNRFPPTQWLTLLSPRKLVIILDNAPYMKFLSTLLTTVTPAIKWTFHFVRRMVIFIFVLPIIFALAICLGFGDVFRGLNIAVRNDEIGFSSCQSYNGSGCTTDPGYNQTLSCNIINYLSSLDYNLVSCSHLRSPEKRDGNDHLRVYILMDLDF